MTVAASIRFGPSGPYQGLARVVVFLGTNYVGTIAEQHSGTYEFVPHRSGPFYTALCLLPGPLVATSDTGIRKMVSGLLAGLEPPSPIPWYVAVRPDGRAWNRPFTSQAAAWRAMVKGANNDREWRQRP